MYFHLIGVAILLCSRIEGMSFLARSYGELQIPRALTLTLQLGQP